MTKSIILNLLFVLIYGFAQSQCIPTVSASGLTNDYITSFTFSSYNLTVNAPEEVCDYHILDSNVSVVPGNSYPMNIVFGAGCIDQYVGLWLDLNGDDVLSTSEMIYSSTSPSSGLSPLNATVVIPSTTYYGNATLRICTKRGAPVLSSEACSLGAQGEYRDYLIIVATNTPCSGVPNSQLINLLYCSSSSGPTVLAKLNEILSGYGLTYTWERADDMVFIANFFSYPNNNKPYIYLVGSNTVYYLRCHIECSFSSLNSYSIPIAVYPNNPTSSISTSDNVEMRVYPTVFDEAIYLDINCSRSEHGELVLQNALGQMISTLTVGLVTGNNHLNIPVNSTIPMGLYYVQFRNEEGRTVPIRLMKGDQ